MTRRNTTKFKTTGLHFRPVESKNVVTGGNEGRTDIDAEEGPRADLQGMTLVELLALQSNLQKRLNELQS